MITDGDRSFSFIFVCFETLFIIVNYNAISDISAGVQCCNNFQVIINYKIVWNRAFIPISIIHQTMCRFSGTKLNYKIMRIKW